MAANSVGQFPAQPVREEATVGKTRRADSFGVDGVVLLQLVDQDPDEPDVVDLGRLREPGADPAVVPMILDPLGIDDEESIPVRRWVEPCSPLDIHVCPPAAVKHEYQRKRLCAVIGGGDMNAIGPRQSPVLDRLIAGVRSRLGRRTGLRSGGGEEQEDTRLERVADRHERILVAREGGMMLASSSAGGLHSGPGWRSSVSPYRASGSRRNTPFSVVGKRACTG